MVTIWRRNERATKINMSRVLRGCSKMSLCEVVARGVKGGWSKCHFEISFRKDVARGKLLLQIMILIIFTQRKVLQNLITFWHFNHFLTFWHFQRILLYKFLRWSHVELLLLFVSVEWIIWSYQVFGLSKLIIYGSLQLDTNLIINLRFCYLLPSGC